jgi:hypothetical protein
MKSVTLKFAYQILFILFVAGSQLLEIGDHAIFLVGFLEHLLGDPAAAGLTLRPERVQEVNIAVLKTERAVRTGELKLIIK